MALGEGLEKAARHLKNPSPFVSTEVILGMLPANSLKNAAKCDLGAGWAPEYGCAKVVEEVAIEVDHADDDFGRRRFGLHVPSG